jgi:16S rRNA (guanine1207-N2)-methyltransferase
MSGFFLSPAGDQPVDEDAALDTLLLPFATGELSWPAGERVLFLRARAGDRLPPEARRWTSEQSFRPFADALARAGLASTPSQESDALFDMVLVLPPRQRDESRALLATAVQRVSENGVVLASVLNTEGARSTERDLIALAGPARSLSKNKCRVFWTSPGAMTIDAPLLAQWAALDAPRPIADGRFLSRPGLFAWDRIDAASALLAGCLPHDLSGSGADLGAGFGYLSCEVLARCPRVTALDLFEAEARALALARVNLERPAKDRASPVRLGYHWHDVTTGLPGRYDFIVSNPPFHQGRADQPDLGRAFIVAAAAALNPGGSFWMVANRHLPYESALAQSFAGVRTVKEQDGFKVIEAIKARA